MSEKLSALIDNELDEFERAQVLRDLACDDDLAERWSRYHIIGLAMRRELIVPGDDLPKRVARVLEHEAAPGSPETDKETGKESGRRGSWFRPAGPLAVAASVAGVLLVGGLIVKLYDASQAPRPVTPPAQQVAIVDNATQWDHVDPQVEEALNALLVEHGEFTSASGMNGLTAYAKFVAYDSR